MEILLREIDAETEARLRLSADVHGRSLEAEALAMLTRATQVFAPAATGNKGVPFGTAIRRIIEETGARFPEFEEFSGDFGFVDPFSKDDRKSG